MPRNQGLPIRRIPMNDNAVDIHVGLRAEQAEMQRRAAKPVVVEHDGVMLSGAIFAAIALIVLVLAVVLS